MNVKNLDNIDERGKYIDHLNACLRAGTIGIQKHSALMRAISLRHKIAMDKMLIEEFREQAEEFSAFMQRYESNKDTLRE